MNISQPGNGRARIKIQVLLSPARNPSFHTKVALRRLLRVGMGQYLLREGRMPLANLPGNSERLSPLPPNFFFLPIYSQHSSQISRHHRNPPELSSTSLGALRPCPTVEGDSFPVLPEDATYVLSIILLLLEYFQLFPSIWGLVWTNLKDILPCTFSHNFKPKCIL